VRTVRGAIDKRGMTALSSGHLATDFANGALPALLPFFADEFDLSYVLVGLAMLAWAFSSSVLQPLFGLWSDSRGAIWLLPAGLALGGLGIGLAALAPSYWVCLVLIALSGLGTAAFHPEGARFAAYVSGRRRASGMSFFSIGGNIGYALGPIAATFLVVHFGLEAGLLLALPCLVVSALLVRAVPYLQSFEPSRESVHAGAGDDRVGAILALLGVVAFRAVAWFGLITFVPLYEVARGHSEAYGNRLLAAMLLAGGVGTIVAGPLADRFGRRPVLVVSVLATGPLILAYLTVGGPAGAVALALVGPCVVGTFGVTMVMSQEYLPRHIGLASGLTIGLSIGLGGMAAVALGAIADAVDLETALYVCAAAPFAALALCLVLQPTRAGRARLAAEPVV
jgi:MFS transporter, FSR family, fosmidomycin resistance protein